MTIADDTPATATGDSLQAEQVCFHQDARTDATDDNRSVANDASYTDGQAALLSVTDNFVEYQITPEYDIDDVQIQLREEALTSDDITITWALNGEQIAQYTTNNAIASGIDWRTKSFYVTPLSGVSLPAGETATFRIDVDSTSGGQYVIDRVAVYDRSYESDLTFDNTVDGNSQLSGPELYANEVSISLNQTETRRDVTEADVDSTWDDTSNGQYIELRIGSDSFDRTNNSETASTTGGPARTIDVTLGLSRYGSRTNDTPTEGFNGQSVDVYELVANPSAVNPYSLATAEVDAVVAPGSVTGDRLSEAGQLTASNDLLTHSIFASFDVFAATELRSSEKTAFDAP